MVFWIEEVKGRGDWRDIYIRVEKGISMVDIRISTIVVYHINGNIWYSSREVLIECTFYCDSEVHVRTTRVFKEGRQIKNSHLFQRSLVISILVY